MVLLSISITIKDSTAELSINLLFSFISVYQPKDVIIGLRQVF